MEIMHNEVLFLGDTSRYIEKLFINKDIKIKKIKTLF